MLSVYTYVGDVPLQNPILILRTHYEGLTGSFSFRATILSHDVFVTDAGSGKPFRVLCHRVMLPPGFFRPLLISGDVILMLYSREPFSGLTVCFVTSGMMSS